MSIKVGDLFLDLSLDTKNFNNQIKATGNFAQKTMDKAFSGMGSVIAKGLSIVALNKFTKSCLDLGSDLAEVQNVVDVTFPHMNAQVDSFAKNAINQFGLSETVAKRMTGTYGAMSKAFGFSEKSAYDMATTLTGLAGDVASFYNLDPTEAYTKLKSVFSGETETLKDLGIVMTQNALDQYALANGYGRTTSAMSEQEKVALRLAFVTEQLNAAGGDFARTSDSWANKVRVLSLNFQSLKATLGQGLINILSPIISLLNTVITKLQIAAKYFVAFTSLLTGKKNNTTLGSVADSAGQLASGLGGASSGAANLANNVGGIGKAAKKAAKEMGSLASFDEIKNIKSPSDSQSDTGGGSGGGASGIGENGFDLIGGTQDALGIDTSKMEESLNKMRKMWENFTGFLTKHKAIIISLLAGIAAWFAVLESAKIFNSLLGITTYISNLFKVLKVGLPGLNALSLEFTGLSLASIGLIAGIAAITSSLVYLYQTNESFRNLVNESVSLLTSILMNLWTGVVSPLFTFLGSVFSTIVVPLTNFLATVFVKGVEAVATVTLSLWKTILAPIANFLVSILSIAIQGVLDVWSSWKPFIDELFSKLNWLWQNILSPLVDFIVGTFCDGFRAWGSLIEKLIPSVTAIFQGLIDFFVGVFTLDMDKAWSGIQQIFSGFSNYLNTVFSQDWTEVLGYLGVPLNAALSTINSIWNTIKGVFNGIVTFISGVFIGNWKQAWQGVKDIFASIVSGLGSIFKTPINFIIDGINTFIRGLNRIKIPSWVPGVGGKGFNIGTIPRLAEGGYVKANTPQLAMIGDNRTQGEIVSPENKMYDVMMNALKSYGVKNAGKEDIQVLVSILYEILEAIKNLRLIVDGDSLNDDGKRRDRERALRTGKLIME